MANEAGNAVKFDDPKVIEALQYWVDLGKQACTRPASSSGAPRPRISSRRRSR
jgi:sn-glycerol 3-phosphate transport system substrate-binding protein